MSDWAPIRDQIKERLRLSEIVGRKVLWDRRKSSPGRGEFWACCPFHNEKSASFHVLDREGYYKCFGCGVGGDVVEFVMQTENRSFREAMEMLAEEAGVELPKFSREEQERAQTRASLHDVLEKASVFFEESLRLSPGEGARAYLKRRGLPNEVWKEFRLGYWPDGGRALIDHLKANGIDEEQMRATGLLANREGEARDHMRHRLIFPITDGRGRVIAFGGRALREDQQPKYLNTGETALFHKGRTLYNFAKARGRASKSSSPVYGGSAPDEIRGEGGHEASKAPSVTSGDTPPVNGGGKEKRSAYGRLVVAEGYMDVIALSRSGFARAVAPLGTALTEEQLNLLWSVEEAPIICFDGDAAGLAAAGRALDRALPLLKPGRTLQFAFLPPGQDPDDLLKAEGPDAVAQVIASARGLAETYWDFTTSKADLQTPDGRARAEAELHEGIRRIADTNVRRHYEAFIRGRIGEWFQSPRRTTGQSGGRRDNKNFRPGQRGAFNEPAPRPTAELRARRGRSANAQAHLTEEIFLLSLLTHPGLAHQLIEEAGAVELSGDLGTLHRAVLAEIARGRTDTEEIVKALDAAGLAGAARRLISRQGLRCVPSAHPAAAPEAAEASLKELIASLAAKAEASEVKDQLKAALGQGLSEEAWAEARRLHEQKQRQAGGRS